ncbi:MAG: PD-(D/E)XK nuclease family protein, partial [Eubacterium sp.]
AGMGRRFNTKSHSGRVLFHKDLGICPDKVDPESRLIEPTIAKALCGDRVRVESLSEEMRLLYVAMTRAMESLILVGGVKDFKGNISRWQHPASLFYLKKAQCFLDWVMLSAVDGGPVVPALPEDGGEAITSMGCYDITLHPWGSGESAVIGKEAETLALENSGEIELAEEVRRRLAWRYPSQGAVEPPEKMTVTEIAKVRAGNLENGGDAPELVIRPAFLQQSADGFAPAELGTGIHTILQGLDLKKIRGCGQDWKTLGDTIEKQAADMAARERIAPALLAALNLEPIQRFFTTETGQRLLAAKTLQRELPFNYQVEAARIRPEWAGKGQTITIQGMIDCCFLEDNAWVLFDYKTDRFFGAKEKERLVARYQTQLGLYAEALAALTGIPVKEQRLCFLMENV